MRKNRIFWGGALAVLLFCVLAAIAQVPIVGSIVNAVTGFTVNGLAPSGQVICGNGSAGTYSASCPIAAQTAASLATAPTQCSGSTPMSTGVQANGDANCASAPSGTRSCNANGCYRVASDGTIEAWGSVTMAASGNSYNSVGITFPVNFTTQPSLTFATVGIAGSGDSTTPPCSGVQSSSTSSATLYFARCIIASAGGGNFDNSLAVNWHAFGY